MNIKCSICLDLFGSKEDEKLDAARCGHVFHSDCLARWIETKRSCPECRSFTTPETVLSLFVNIADNPSSTDIDDLQKVNVHLNTLITEHSVIIKRNLLMNIALQKEINELKLKQFHSYKEVYEFKKKFEQSEITIKKYSDKIKAMQDRLTDVSDTTLKRDLRSRNNNQPNLSDGEWIRKKTRSN